LAASKFLILLIVFLFGFQVSAESCPDTPAYKKRQTIIIQLNKLLGYEKDPAQRADLLFRMAKTYNDQYFDCPDRPKEQLELAIKTYGQIIEYENSSIADYAVYKLAWIHINLQEFEKAGQLFVKIIKSDHKTALRKCAARPIEQNTRKLARLPPTKLSAWQQPG